jgi:hypothetical protein
VTCDVCTFLLLSNMNDVRVSRLTPVSFVTIVLL